MPRIGVVGKPKRLVREGADMNNYLDRSWAVMENTIIAYNGSDSVLKIPSRFADMRVLYIGDGSFMGSDKMQQVFIPQGVIGIGSESFQCCETLVNVYIPGTVNKIGDKVFAGCDNIVNLTFYDIEFSERRYNDLKSSCRKAGGSLYVAQSFPDLEVVKSAILSMGAKPAATVPEMIERIFLSQNLHDEVGRASLSRNLDRLEFSNAEGSLTEEESFISLIGADAYSTFDKDAEIKNDAFARVEEYPRIRRTAVFTFEDDKTRVEGDKRRITANVKIGYQFWQSKVPIKYNGRDYYIYRRHYLSGDAGINYIRRDTAVFTKAGIVTNKREAQEIYAKYKLLSIL